MVKLKLKRIGLLKGSLLGMFLGFFGGFILGIIVFFLQIILISLLSGFGVLSSSSSISILKLFVYIPISSAISGFIGGFIFFGLTNLGLKMFKGWDFEVEEVSEEEKKTVNKESLKPVNKMVVKKEVIKKPEVKQEVPAMIPVEA